MIASGRLSGTGGKTDTAADPRAGGAAGTGV